MRGGEKLPLHRSPIFTFFVNFGVQRVSRPNCDFCLDFAPEVIEKTGCFYSYFAFRGRNPSSGPDFFLKKSPSTDLAICAFLGGTGEGGRELPLQRMVPRTDFYTWIWPYDQFQV